MHKDSTRVTFLPREDSYRSQTLFSPFFSTLLLLIIYITSKFAKASPPPPTNGLRGDNRDR